MTPAEQRIANKADRFKRLAESATSYRRAIAYVRKFDQARAQLIRLGVTLAELSEEKQEYRCIYCHKTSTLARAAQYGVEARGLPG